MNRLILAEVVKNALQEDIFSGDITSEAIFETDFQARASFIAKSSGVAAGFPVVIAVFNHLDPKVVCYSKVPEGSQVAAGEIIGEVTGSIKAILSGERVALNFLQRLSGIATQTANLAKLIEGYPARIVDTRKTTPGLRILEKYAVRQGGGLNHRFNLADAVLIKDNHIAACGSIGEAVRRVRLRAPHTMRIEVEVENEAQVCEALEAKADIIMLDNMSVEEMTRMVGLINHRAIVEASGNINETTIKNVAATGVDIISVGSITHSVKALDISLDIHQ
ncbi:MAG TPA: carboxylating nicotinate-nucleotide diphosphorylase [Bacillota bacterium]|nr:carboxylating nicotinate-nucleotide diphosphorylase [Bacillota bacterium]